MGEDIRVLFFEENKEKVWESDYIINGLLPKEKNKVVAYTKSLSTLLDTGVWDVLVFNCRRVEFNTILQVVEKINPKIIIQLSDEYKHENLNHFNCLAKYCNLYLRQYHHDGYEYHPNTVHIPLGYTNNAGIDFMDILPEGMNKPPKVKKRIYNWSWVGEIKQDRWEMLQIFSNIPRQSYVLNCSKDDMIERYLNSNFVPCGRGNSTLDCYRLYESSQCGAIPCVVGTHTEIDSTFKYEENPPWIFGHSWHHVVFQVKELLFDSKALQERQDSIISWWNRRINKIRSSIKKSLDDFERTDSSNIVLNESIIDHYWEDDNIFGENWFSYPNLYKQVVENAKDGDVFVELGAWKGRSTSCLAVEIANSKKDIDLYVIDTWEDDEIYKQFINNMKPVEKYFFPLKLSSIDAVKKFKDKSVDFVFLDASEIYEDVKEDITNWLPKVKPGGVLAGHDYYPEGHYDWFPGVKNAVNELVSDFETSELCFIHHVPKDIKNKFEGFPSVNFISVTECEDRRNLLYKKFKEHGITNITPHIYDRYKDEDHNIRSKLLDRLSIGSRGPVTSHLKAVKEWYYETDEPYTIICEDDLGFQTVKYWNFTWKEFFESLPPDWGCVQLGLLRENFYSFNIGFRNRCWCDWSGVAYLISREHARRLINAYYRDDIFTLNYIGDDILSRPEWAKIPVIETIIYSNLTRVYSCPLFVEDMVNCPSSYFSTAGIRTGEVDWVHEHSFESAMNWWKTEGRYKNPLQLVTT